MSVSDKQAVDTFREYARQAGLDVSDVSVVTVSESGSEPDREVRYVSGAVTSESAESGDTVQIEASLAVRPDDTETPAERIEFIIDWYAQRGNNAKFV